MTIKVGFDYDEPIFAWFDYAHEASIAAGLTLPDSPPPTQWDPHSVYGCTWDEWVAVLDAEVERGFDGMYARPATLESVEAVRELYSKGFEAHLVTARGQFGRYGKEIQRLTKSQVIRENIPHNSLVFTEDKFTAIRDLELDYFIDDRDKYFLEAEKAGAEAYLLDRPWNRDFKVPSGRRVYSTRQYVDLIIKREGPQNVLTIKQRSAINDNMPLGIQPFTSG